MALQMLQAAQRRRQHQTSVLLQLERQMLSSSVCSAKPRTGRTARTDWHM